MTQLRNHISIKNTIRINLLVIFFSLIGNLSFSQDYELKAINRRREVSITIACFRDSVKVYTGKLDCYKFVNFSNATHLAKGETFFKSDSCNTLNFCCDSLMSPTNEDYVFVKANQLLKIRILPGELVRFPKKKKHLVCLTINGETQQVYSKWYNSRFKLIKVRKQQPEYIICLKHK